MLVRRVSEGFSEEHLNRSLKNVRGRESGTKSSLDTGIGCAMKESSSSLKK